MNDLMAVYNRELSLYEELRDQAVRTQEQAQQKSEVLTALETALGLMGTPRSHTPSPVEVAKGTASGKRKYNNFWPEVVQWICDTSTSKKGVTRDEVITYIQTTYHEHVSKARVYAALDNRVKKGTLMRDGNQYYNPTLFEQAVNPSSDYFGLNGEAPEATLNDEATEAV
jgi:hypothetical protein